MKYIVLLSFCLLSPIFLCAQAVPEFSVYLIGDAGEDTASGKALLMLKEQLIKDTASAVVFLGDNVYPSGFSLNNANSQLHLRSQLNILKQYRGQAYFIPGNHDWNAQRRGGLEKIAAQQKYVNEFMLKESACANRSAGSFFPADGLPGPATVMLNGKLRLIMIDTQWFLHFHKKNKTGSTRETIEVFYRTLDSLLVWSDYNKEQVIIAAHHPMFTNGGHSRKNQPLRFMVNYTPLRIFGLMGLDRLYSQDIFQPRYRRMRKRMTKEFNKFDNIVFVSGHEHNVQVFREGKVSYIISGNGSKLSHLRKKKRFIAVFEDDKTTGFVRLKYSRTSKLITEVYRVGEEVRVVE
jgi:predicted phosphodiesterase